MHSIQLDNVISLDWSYRIQSIEEFSSIPFIISKLTISANTCNEIGLTELAITGLTNLNSIVIEENALSNVLVCDFTSLPSLHSLIVKDSSLSNTTSYIFIFMIV